MARRSFSAASYTPTATADTATTLANGTYQAIGASGATSRLNIKEIWIGGQATASAVNIMQFARDHVLGATLTALAAPNSDGPLDTATAALAAVPLTYVAATTPPQRSILTTAPRLSLSMNAWGGAAVWHAGPGEEWGITGVTVDVSESSLSAYTGGNVGLIGSHIIYEPE
jgi:hypothetical protein